MYRDYRTGKFKSKRQADLEAKVPLFMILIGTTVALMFGFALQTTVWTLAPAQVYASTDLCELQSVICENENIVTKADQAVLDIPHESEQTTQTIRYIYEHAEQNGIDGDVISHIIWCESMFWNIQSQLDYNFSSPSRGIVADTQELSFGLVMVHIPDHDVTREQALDPEFAVRWAVDKVAKGQFIWNGYSANNDDCNNSVAEYWL